MANLFASPSGSSYNLMNDYRGPIKDSFNQDVPVYRGAENMKFNWSGAQVNRPLKLLRNQGIGAGSDGGNLPSIGRQGGAQAVISAKYHWLRFGLTAGMLKASQSDKGAFVRQFQWEMEAGMKDFKSEANRIAAWDGTGTVATVNTNAAASTSLVIAGRESTEPALKFISPNAVVDIYSSAGALVQASVTISAISSGGPNDSTATLTVSPAVTCSATDILVRSGSYSNEAQGLLTALDGGTTTIYSIDRSLYLQYQGNVSTVSGQLTLDSIQGAQNSMEQRGGGALNAIYSDFLSRRYYQKLLTPDKRYVNSTKGDGGFASKDKSYLEWNGVPWVADKDCPTRIFLLPNDAIEKAVLCEMEPAEETGSAYIAQTGVDAWEVRLRHFYNYFNAQPAACAVLKTYTSP